MLTPCQKCLRSFLTLPSAFILSVFVDYTEFSEVSMQELEHGKSIFQYSISLVSWLSSAGNYALFLHCQLQLQSPLHIRNS